MTEKQMIKLKGKRVRFTFREHQYSIKSEVIEGIVLPEETTINLVRDNQMKSYKHWDMMILDNNKEVKTILWNQLKNISNLEVLDD